VRPAPSPNDTIAAVATPAGTGGIAVVRISGAQAIPIAESVFQRGGSQKQPLSQVASHTVHHGHIERDGVRIDEVLVTILRAPRTFTREETVEISCHGGRVVTRQVLETLLAAGARLAEPGEFTLRAFLNGRLDLTQAEAVADLIHARTTLAAQAAVQQLGGRLSERLRGIRDDLLNILAHVEAHIDFPEEDIAPDSRDRMLHRLDGARCSIRQLRLTASEGRILREGVRIAIIGRPNAGKSSLLNLLIGSDRAIVSAIPGTTRDTVEECATVRGLPLVFVDTAGLRETQDPVEAEGIRRSLRAAAEADLILHVLDGTQAPGSIAEELGEALCQKPTIRVRNKADLPNVWDEASLQGAIPLSATTGEGLEDLKATMDARLGTKDLSADHWSVTVNARQSAALAQAEDSLTQAQAALSRGDSLELVALDLRATLGALGEITGHVTTDSLLDSIFGQFCLGK
jgi:tRNA modification GTPase